MRLYALLLKDRHCDDEVRLFDTFGEARDLADREATAFLAVRKYEQDPVVHKFDDRYIISTYDDGPEWIIIGPLDVSHS